MGLLDKLNDKQYEAVTCTEGPSLVIAGAGSGKTKVLTHKIAYLIGEKYIKPWNILAITFTNKAAKEMKMRLTSLIGTIANACQVSTFHSFGLKLLRENYELLGYDKNFCIMDSDDSLTVVKKIIKDLGYDPKVYNPRAIRNKISIGHKRINIYLSNLIVVVITSLFSYIVFLGIVSAIGIPLLGKITITLSQLFMLLGCIFVTVTAYSSIFTFMAMIISNKTITSIVCIMLSFGMMMIALTCFNILETPKTIQKATMLNGETKIEEVPNPKYPSEKKKKVCQTVLDFNPAGQMFQIAGRSAASLKILPLYSLGILVIFTGAGLVLFRKKELK